MPCTQVCHELLVLDKDPRQHKLITDQADSLKPFSHLTASTLSFQFLCSGLLQKKNPSIYFTPHICKLGPTLSSTLLWWLNKWGHSGLCHLSKTFLALSWMLSNILMISLTTAVLPSGGNKLKTLYALSTFKCPPAQLQLSTKTIQPADFGWWRSFYKKKKKSFPKASWGSFFLEFTVL